MGLVLKAFGIVTLSHGGFSLTYLVLFDCDFMFFEFYLWHIFFFSTRFKVLICLCLMGRKNIGTGSLYNCCLRFSDNTAHGIISPKVRKCRLVVRNFQRILFLLLPSTRLSVKLGRHCTRYICRTCASCL